MHTNYIVSVDTWPTSARTANVGIIRWQTGMREYHASWASLQRLERVMQQMVRSGQADVTPYALGWGCRIERD